MDVRAESKAPGPAQGMCQESSLASCSFAAPAGMHFDRAVKPLHACAPTRPFGGPSADGFATFSKTTSPDGSAAPASAQGASSSTPSPDAVVDITCFLRTRVGTQGPTTPKMKDMECLLMSPTRRNGKKAGAWQWNYSTANALANGGFSDGPSAKTTPVSSPTGCAAADAAAAAVGSLQVGTPVALAAGLLADASDRT